MTCTSPTDSHLVMTALPALGTWIDLPPPQPHSPVYKKVTALVPLVNYSHTISSRLVAIRLHFLLASTLVTLKVVLMEAEKSLRTRTTELLPIRSPMTPLIEWIPPDP